MTGSYCNTSTEKVASGEYLQPMRASVRSFEIGEYELFEVGQAQSRPKIGTDLRIGFTMCRF